MQEEGILTGVAGKMNWIGRGGLREFLGARGGSGDDGGGLTGVGGRSLDFKGRGHKSRGGRGRRRRLFSRSIHGGRILDR